MRSITRMGRFGLVLGAVVGVTAAALAVGGGAAARGQDGSVPVKPGAKPLPVDAAGIPVAADEAMNTIGPNQDMLIAIKPAGSKNWYAPADVGATQVGAEGAQLSTGTPGGASEATFFGCYGVDRFPPSYVAPGVIQGGEDFIECTDLASTTASVRLKESSTYGTHAARITGHAGNADWTAWSQTFICQNISRSWQTVATNIYTALDGTSATYVGAGAWAGGFYC